MVDDEDRSNDPLSGLYSRPGFLIRRANQIAVWLFLDEAAPLPITTTQYGAMVVLRATQNIDQIGLAKMLGIDRSTAALVVGKLKAAGYIALGRDAMDKRRKVLTLTEVGAATLDAMRGPARQARERLLAALTKEEAQQFTILLETFVSTFNKEARTPLATPYHPE